MNNDKPKELGIRIKQQRVMIPLTLEELGDKSGVSSSHLGRIERGERFPSAHILRKIAEPLGFDEDELLVLAGFRSPGKGGTSLDLHLALTMVQELTTMRNSINAMLKALRKRIVESGKS